jgi:hypothetical protein
MKKNRAIADVGCVIFTVLVRVFAAFSTVRQLDARQT